MIEMNKKQRIIVLALPVSLLFFSGSQEVKADDTGWFVGGGLSRLDADFEHSADLSLDDSDNTWNIKGGYMFNDIFGLEAGYVDLGDYEAGEDFKIDADAYWIGGIANWSVSQSWDLYAKAGVAIVDASSDQFIPQTGDQLKKNDTDEQPYFGLGAEYDFGTWGIFAEYSVMDTDVHDLTVDIVTLGLKYEFGQ